MAVLPLKDAFTARVLGEKWNDYKQSLGLPPYLGRSFFGTDKQDGLDISFIKGSKGLPVALKASNFDAEPALRDGIGFSTIQNEMPFFRESYVVTEREEQDYASLVSNAGESRANQILKNIMKNSLDLVNGANVIPERQIWQLLAPEDGIPRIKVLIDNTEPYYIDYTGDSGVAYKATNYMELASAADKWSASNTATPIQDLLDAKDQHMDNHGEVLTRFVMNSKTWRQFCNAEDTRKQILGLTAYNEGMRLTPASVKAYMFDMFGIEIYEYNQMYKEGSVSSTFIPDGIVSAIAGNVNQLGTVMYGTTPEERKAGEYDGDFALVETGVAIHTYLSNSVINTHCKVSEIVLPTYENMDSVFVLKVD